jgi:cation diffusion facilitator CzcD-associated flavoprotein CzcO
MEEMDFKPGKQDTGEPGTTFYPVVIIGSGLSGVAAGCRLKKKLGCNDFLIVERYDGIGVG